MGYKNISFEEKIQKFSRANRLGSLMVQKGIVTPQDLRALLKEQRENKVLLGQLALEKGIVNRATLRSLLFQQSVHSVLLTAAGVISLLLSAVPTASMAETLQRISFAPAKTINLSLERERQVEKRRSAAFMQPALFNTVEKRSHDLAAFTKWNTVLHNIRAQSGSISETRALSDWREAMGRIHNLSPQEQITYVNNFVNQVPYITDSENWGRSDYWATPAQFFARGGDCEDFAIAKYISLKALGFPEQSMRLAIVQDLEKNIPHAVLVVYHEGRAQILDNQIKDIRLASNAAHYKPIYSINQQAWWLHKAPAPSAYMVASAAQ